MEKGKRYKVNIICNGLKMLNSDITIKVLDIDPDCGTLLVIKEFEELKEHSDIIDTLNFITINDPDYYEKNKDFLDRYDEYIISYDKIDDHYETCFGYRIECKEC